MRKILVVIQFSISIFTILATAMMVNQLKHLRTADLGFNKENILIIPARGKTLGHYNEIKQKLMSYPDILSVTYGSDVPDNIQSGEIAWGTRDMIHENQAIAWMLRAGFDFDETFRLEMNEGRFFSSEIASDSVNAIIINRETANIMGYDDPLGKPFYLYDETNEYTIIGIVEDFRFSPLNLAGKAMIIQFEPHQPLIFIKHQPGSVKETIGHAQQVFEEFNPNYPFEYVFYDDYDRVLNNIGESSSILLIYFSFFGIFISGMGLLGLATYSAETRTKEFGIRKTFGATVGNLVIVQTREFSWLIFIAHLIAVPIAYLVIGKVLSFFAYKINLSLWYFVFTMTGVYIISFLTTGWQAVSAARKNPVETLRYE